MMMMIYKSETKKNTILLLVELLAVTWVPCILRYPILLLLLLTFFNDGFGIKYRMKVDMPFNKETKPHQTKPIMSVMPHGLNEE